MKTSELEGAALDWAVAKALGRTDVRVDDDGEIVGQEDFDYSTDWKLAGPIIERENIGVVRIDDEYVRSEQGLKRHPRWLAQVGRACEITEDYMDDGDYYYWAFTGLRRTGPTPLIAAMRCLVISKLGNEVQLPEGV